MGKQLLREVKDDGVQYAKEADTKPAPKSVTVTVNLGSGKSQDEDNVAEGKAGGRRLLTEG